MTSTCHSPQPLQPREGGEKGLRLYLMAIVYSSWSVCYRALGTGSDVSAFGGIRW
jgi:hypothetical protein